MKRLQPHEIEFHPHSFGDAAGRVFIWNEDIYRGIAAPLAKFFASLLADGVIDRLVNQGLLIETRASDVALDGYEMVLQHRRLPFVSYPDEWSAPMLHDAARLIIGLALELVSAGLVLKDSHPWNVLFEGTRPVYVDVTSIARLNQCGWAAYHEFCIYCLNPLLLMISGQDRIARLLLVEEEGVRGQDLLPYLAPRLRWKLAVLRSKRAFSAAMCHVRNRNRFSKHAQDSFGAGELISELQELNSFVERLPMPSYGSAQEILPESDIFFAQFIRETAVSTVLDVSDTAQYARLAAKSVRSVVRFDADPEAAGQLYAQARELSLPILPLVMDFRKPTPARGLADHWSIAAIDRLACDMVVAIGVLPSWVFRGRLTFDHVAEGISGFSKRFAIVEFVPSDRPDVQRMAGESCGWYTIDNLSLALERRFTKVTRVPTLLNSVYLVCQR
jgi:hypothetical protein